MGWVESEDIYFLFSSSEERNCDCLYFASPGPWAPEAQVSGNLHGHNCCHYYNEWGFCFAWCFSVD